MKTITAFFNDSDRARAAAFDLSENSSCCADILVGSLPSEQAQISDYAYTGVFLGAVTGLILGAGASVLPGAGFFARIAVVTGLIAGAVIGAVAGALIDILNYEQSPRCALLSMSVTKENGGRISRSLKKRGAVKVSVEKSRQSR